MIGSTNFSNSSWKLTGLISSNFGLDGGLGISLCPGVVIEFIEELNEELVRFSCLSRGDL